MNKVHVSPPLDAGEIEEEFCPRGSRPALARAGTLRGQQPFCGQNERYLHALSMSKRAHGTYAHSPWDESQSQQWEVLYGNDEQQAAFHYRSALRIVRTDKIEDKPYTSLHDDDTGNRLGSQEQADKLAAANDRHANGRNHKGTLLSAVGRGWRQGITTDDELCNVITQYALFYLRTKWVRLGDNARDVAQRSVHDIFTRLKERNVPLTRRLIEHITGNDALDWLESSSVIHEEQFDEANEDPYTGDAFGPEDDPEDFRRRLPVSHREMRLLSHFVNRLEDQKERTVAEMRLHGHTYSAIAKQLNCSPRYARILEDRAEAALGRMEK